LIAEPYLHIDPSDRKAWKFDRTGHSEQIGTR
jgi:hypothetical protein